jgi:hypothetical protein
MLDDSANVNSLSLGHLEKGGRLFFDLSPSSFAKHHEPVEGRRRGIHPGWVFPARSHAPSIAKRAASLAKHNISAVASRSSRCFHGIAIREQSSTNHACLKIVSTNIECPYPKVVHRNSVELHASGHERLLAPLHYRYSSRCYNHQVHIQNRSST